MEAISPAPFIGRALPVRVATERPGRNRLEVTFTEEHLNAAGAVHGGAIATVIDICVAGAAGSAHDGPGRGYGVTMSLTVNYIAAGRAGSASVVAEVAGGGRNTRFVNAELRDGAGVLIASATATVRVVDWPADG